MYVFITILLINLVLKTSVCIEKGDLAGCFKKGIKYFVFEESHNIEYCLNTCLEKNRYRFAFFKNTSTECGCTNFLGENYVGKPCDESCNSCNLYYTGNFAPTVPEKLIVENVTNTTAHISWTQPNFFLDITEYQVKAKAIKTFANYSANPSWWTFTNNTFDTELGSLNPGTKYKIYVQALSSFTNGDSASVLLETEIGEPDNIPPLPKIIKRDGTKITVQIQSVENHNGPVTSYYVVVFDQDSKQYFQSDLLKSYQQNKEEGLDYYIAAEIEPNKVFEDFIVGDGKYYGGYYNAPLNPKANYLIIQGVVSKHRNITKVVYSDVNNFSEKFQSNKTETNSSSTVFTILVICLVLVSLILVAILIFFVYIRGKASKNRLRRLRDNQELTMQGPILEIVNEGYIPEDEIQPVNYYNLLKQKIWRIPQSHLKVDNKLIGIGNFGSVHFGSVKKDEEDTPAAVVVIYDKKLSTDSKKKMLKELNLLIKSDKHENVVEFIGLCESVDILFVVLEATSTNLKNLLLGSRDTANGRFSSISEFQAVSFIFQISNGIQYLEKQKILHSRLCARNILITSNNTAKIGGYGLCYYHYQNMVADYTRWMAVELFTGQPHTHKSNIWSLACTMWEISTLGGTPYGSILNNEIPSEIRRGLRLPRLPYISQEFYQLMFDCWQNNPEDRPCLSTIVETLKYCQENYPSLLNFQLYPGFQYEQFSMDSELVTRTGPVL